MPLQNFASIEVHVQSKPVYKGKEALKPSDIQMVVDSRGCPDALIQHPAFDPIVEKCTFSTPIEKLSSPVEKIHDNILKQFPLPPIDKSAPCRPKAAPPLYDDLLPPNPALEKQPSTAAHPDIHREPYRQLITPSSRYPNVVQPQAWGEPNVSRGGYRRQEGDSQKTMMHSNISTKSLGANVRLKDSPVRRVVVNPPARQESRPRMHSSTSSGSVMTSSRRLEPRQRQNSNASIAIQPAEYGHVSHSGSHSHRTPSSSRPPRPSHRS